MKIKPRLWGSTAALVVGVLAIIGGLSASQGSTVIAGLVMVIGSLCYRSAKRASLGVVAKSTGRQIAELFGVVLILAIIGLQRNLLDLMYTDPFPNLIIPLWTFVAYAVAKLGAAEASRAEA